MRQRAAATWQAIRACWLQSWLALDQVGNAFLLGVLAILCAAWTGKTQAVAFADETLSAHCWRAYSRGKLWGRFWMPVIDWMFRWQGWRDHCRQAYLSEQRRRDMPPEYRQ